MIVEREQALLVLYPQRKQGCHLERGCGPPWRPPRWWSAEGRRPSPGHRRRTLDRPPCRRSGWRPRPDGPPARNLRRAPPRSRPSVVRWQPRCPGGRSRRRGSKARDRPPLGTSPTVSASAGVIPTAIRTGGVRTGSPSAGSVSRSLNSSAGNIPPKLTASDVKKDPATTRARALRTKVEAVPSKTGRL